MGLGRLRWTVGSQVHFKTVSDLFAAVRKNAHKLPRDVDVVVGVPRSGMIAACAASLVLHKHYVDLPGFLEGRTTAGFSQRHGLDGTNTEARSALVIDDSVYSGASLRRARDAVAASGWSGRATYAAVYGEHSAHPDADVVLDICPTPRVFEWNVLNHWSLEHACVDLDGVLCADPSEAENDDGAKYAIFLETAEVLNAPQYEIHSIVTSRLEKYRAQTEAWLSKNGVRYKHLLMLDLPSAADRRRVGVHAQFKADIFKQRDECPLFIESEPHQAAEIWRLSGKSVLCYTNMSFVSGRPSLRQRLGRALPSRVKRYLTRIL